MPAWQLIASFAVRLLAAFLVPVACAYCVSAAKVMARQGRASTEDSAVGFDLLVAAGALAITILTEAVQARVENWGGPAPSGFAERFILGLVVLVVLLFGGYILARYQNKRYVSSPEVLINYSTDERQQLFELSPIAAKRASQTAGAAFAAVFLLYWQQQWVIDNILVPFFEGG